MTIQASLQAVTRVRRCGSAGVSARQRDCVAKNERSNHFVELTQSIVE